MCLFKLNVTFLVLCCCFYCFIHCMIYVVFFASNFSPRCRPGPSVRPQLIVLLRKLNRFSSCAFNQQPFFSRHTHTHPHTHTSRTAWFTLRRHLVALQCAVTQKFLQRTSPRVIATVPGRRTAGTPPAGSRSAGRSRTPPGTAPASSSRPDSCWSSAAFQSYLQVHNAPLQAQRTGERYQ